jgi:hypothetical protein
MQAFLVGAICSSDRDNHEGHEGWNLTARLGPRNQPSPKLTVTKIDLPVTFDPNQEDT